jgi:hypothetical protein
MICNPLLTAPPPKRGGTAKNFVPTIYTDPAEKRSRTNRVSMQVYHYLSRPSLMTKSIQHQRQLKTFKQLYKAVETNYVDGRPRHLSAPDTSVFSIITQDQFDSMSVAQLQALHRRYHIVVTGLSQAEHEFTAEGLEALTWKTPERVFTVQGNPKSFSRLRKTHYLDRLLNRRWRH